MDEAAVGYVDDGQFGDDHVDDLPAGQRQRTRGKNLVAAVARRVLHRDDHAPDARDEIHGAAHPFHHLARNHPVGEIPCLVHLQRAQHREVDVSAADHRKRIGTVEIRAARRLGR